MQHPSTQGNDQVPFVRVGPTPIASPVVLSVPHAGRDYSESLLKASRLKREQLEALEDRFVDRLIWRALDLGATALIARRPRAEIDLNRHEAEIDASLVVPPPSNALPQSARTRGGLGLIPTRITGAGPIWLHRIQHAELERRITRIYRPYHDAVEGALEEARARFGLAILLDCHSMPPRAEPGLGQAEIVFGDLHGTTIAPELLDAALDAARRCGFRTACNVPYAGGYITARHGKPTQGLHALQIELDRSIYLAPDMRTPGKGFERTAEFLAELTGALAARATEGPRQPLAAE